jgi:zinc D-Ala-D-Ala carboxypeptidase
MSTFGQNGSVNDWIGTVGTMKRLHLLIGFSLFLLTGCSQIDSLLKKVPFIHKKIEVQDKGPTTQNPSPPKELTLESIFFNEIQSVAGKNIIQNPHNLLALVNKQFSLPGGYTPQDLTRPNVPFSFGNQEVDKSLLRREASKALEKMFANAQKNGIELLAVSGFRSYERQEVLFNAEVKRVGEEQAVQTVAIPGTSEHQTGLAMDISSQSVSLNLTETFGETKEGKWVRDNAHRFGFILRYPKGKETITGYQYEPWHFRFVGEKSALTIYEKKLTLEEYFNIVEKI